MTKAAMTLQDCITLASKKGFRVRYSERDGGWWITTPKAARRPSQTLGLYRDERTAWVDAALLAQQEQDAKNR